MTRYSDHSGGMDGTLFYEYHCDSCGDTIQLSEFEKLPDGWLQLGVKYETSRHLCRSCRYAGAVDLVTNIRISTVTQQLRQTGSTASKILMHKDIPPQVKHAARMVIIDLQLCTEQLKKVSIATESLGY